MSLVRRLLRRRAIDPKSTVAAEVSIEDVAVLVRAGRYAEALRTIDGALTRQPDDANWLFARGSLLFEWGRLWEARTALLSIHQKGARQPGLDLQLGWIELRAGKLSDAERWMRSAVEQNDERWQSHYGLAAVLRAAGNCEAGADCYERALEQSPGNLDCLLGLVGCAIARRNLADAERFSRCAIAEHGEAVSAWASLGAVLIWQDRFDEANQAFDRIREISSAKDAPGDIPLDAGIALRDGGRVKEAIDFYRRALRWHPDLNAHAHYAYSLLKAGQLREGWEQNEFRWMIEPLRTLRARIGSPVWAGQDVEGKTVLVMAEQGIGDVIQFIRYVKFVKALGATTLVLLRKPMREIVDGMTGVDRVYELGEPLPKVDFIIPVMSLPRAFGTTLDSIPAPVPYVPLQPERVERWRRVLPADETLKVGVAWSGDRNGLRNPYKSIPLPMLASLGNVPGVRFYSLQKGDAARDIVAHASTAFELIDLSPEIQDFADTAAIINSLDLVVSVCTSVAHLAGALGKPVWTLLSEPADWRWLEHRNDTPWYPTMRLFRQPQRGDWRTVIDEVKRALEDFTLSRRAPMAGPALFDASVDPLLPVTTMPAPSGPLCRAVATRFGILQLRPADTRAARSLDWYGEYRWQQLDLLRGRIKPGAVAIDMASGCGFDASVLASAAGDTGHLFVFESRPELLPLLANNIGVSGLSNVTTMTMPIKGNPHVESKESFAMPGAMPDALDDLCLPRFQWLKINEDADAVAILEGAANCLWAFRPSIFVATCSPEEMDRVTDCVHNFGYQAVRIDSPLFDAGNFNARTEDIFGGEWSYALLATPEEQDVELASFDRRIVAPLPH